MATLTVTLVDGTLVPLLLETRPRTVDIAVDVTVELSKKAPPESVPALKASLLQLRGELDECRGDSGAAGVAKLARLVLEQDGPGSGRSLRQELHRRDKQERLLVELVRAYRLFGHTYLLLTLENRDPSTPWALGKVELATEAARQAMELPVLAAEMDVPAIAPNETGRLVVAFRSPPPRARERVRLSCWRRTGPGTSVSRGSPCELGRRESAVPAALDGLPDRLELRWRMIGRPAPRASSRRPCRMLWRGRGADCSVP